MYKIGFLSLMVMIFVGCNKVEGPGGTSSITGKLIVNDVNGAGDLVATYLGQDEDVYLIYGEDNTTYNDKVSTSFDGTYRFDYLMPGIYKLFAYSDCDTCASGQIQELVSVQITDKKQVVSANDIVVVR